MGGLMKWNWKVVVGVLAGLIVGFLMGAVVAVSVPFSEQHLGRVIAIGAIIQAIGIVVLLVLTAWYAWQTHVIAAASRESANATVDMAEAAKQQMAEYHQDRLDRGADALTRHRLIADIKNNADAKRIANMQRKADAIGHFFHHNQYATTREAGLLSALRADEIMAIHDLFAEVRAFVAEVQNDYDHGSGSEFRPNPNFALPKWIEEAEPLRQRFELFYQTIQERYGPKGIVPD